MPFPPPGALPNLGTEPGSPALKAGSLPSEPPGKADTGVAGLESFAELPTLEGLLPCGSSGAERALSYIGGSSHILSICGTSCRLEIADGDSDWKPDTRPYFQSRSAEAGLRDALRRPAAASVPSEACCSAACCMDVRCVGKPASAAAACPASASAARLLRPRRVPGAPAPAARGVSRPRRCSGGAGPRLTPASLPVPRPCSRCCLWGSFFPRPSSTCLPESSSR